MIGEDQQFKGIKGEWVVKIKLLESQVYIETISQSSMQHFQASMTIEKIKEDKNFGFLFQTIPQLFKFLESSFADLVVKRGEISFLMDMPLGRITRKIQLKIPTIKKEIDLSNLRDIKMQKLQTDINDLKQQSGKLNKKLEESTLQIQKMKKVLLNFQKTLEQKDQVINSIFVELKEIRLWKQQRQNEQQSRLKRRFIADSSNPHNIKFMQMGNRFKKTSGGSWDLLICKHQIQKNQIFKYSIRQIKAGAGGSFMYGIGTASIRGVVRAQDNKQFIGYYQNTGNIYDKGESKKGGPRIKDGDIIVIEINTKNWSISWTIQGVKEAEIPLIGDLKVKPIFLAIVVYNEDAEIQFI